MHRPQRGQKHPSPHPLHQPVLSKRVTPVGSGMVEGSSPSMLLVIWSCGKRVTNHEWDAHSHTITSFPSTNDKASHTSSVRISPLPGKAKMERKQSTQPQIMEKKWYIPVENVPAKRNKLTQCCRSGDLSAHLQDDRFPLIDTHMSFG